MKHFLFAIHPRLSLLTLSFAAMKKTAISFLCLVFFCTCNNNDQGSSRQAENDLDAARLFIRNALDGKWDEAKQFLVQDSVNVQLLETAENKYNALNKQEQQNYKDAEPRFYDSRKINDSITVVNYSNSYMNRKDSLKIVRVNGQWLIDLKYSLLPNRSNVQ